MPRPQRGEETVLQAPARQKPTSMRRRSTPCRRSNGAAGRRDGGVGDKRGAREDSIPPFRLRPVSARALTGGGFQRSQVWNRFNENVALSVSIPIFSNRKNRTAVNKARIAASNSRPEQLGLEKELLRKRRVGLPRRHSRRNRATRPPGRRNVTPGRATTSPTSSSASAGRTPSN